MPFLECGDEIAAFPARGARKRSMCTTNAEKAAKFCV